MKNCKLLIVIFVVFINAQYIYAQKELFVFINTQLCFNCKTLNLSPVLSQFKNNNFKIIMAPQSVAKVEEKTIESVLRESFDFDSINFNYKSSLIKDNYLAFIIKNNESIFYFDELNNESIINTIFNMVDNSKSSIINEDLYPLINLHDVIYLDEFIYFQDSFQNSILKYDIQLNKIISNYKVNINPFESNFTEEDLSFMNSINIKLPKIKRIFAIQNSIYSDIDIFNKRFITPDTSSSGNITYDKNYESNDYLFKLNSDSLIIQNEICTKIADKYFIKTDSYQFINDSLYFGEFFNSEDYMGVDKFNTRIALINANNCNVIDSARSIKETMSSSFSYNSKIIFLNQNQLLVFNYQQKKSSFHSINNDSLTSFNSDLFSVSDSLLNLSKEANDIVNNYDIEYFNNKIYLIFTLENKINSEIKNIIMIFNPNLQNTGFILYNIDNNDKLLKSKLIAANHNIYLLQQFKEKRWVLTNIGN